MTLSFGTNRHTSDMESGPTAPASFSTNGWHDHIVLQKLLIVAVTIPEVRLEATANSALFGVQEGEASAGADTRQVASIKRRIWLIIEPRLTKRQRSPRCLLRVSTVRASRRTPIGGIGAA